MADCCNKTLKKENRNQNELYDQLNGIILCLVFERRVASMAEIFNDSSIAFLKQLNLETLEVK
jgi:hypothetical protein